MTSNTLAGQPTFEDEIGRGRGAAMAWRAETTSGRRGLRLALASILGVAGYTALAVAMVATTPDDGEPDRPLFLASSLVFILAILCGLVAAGLLFFAFFRRHDRSRFVVGVVALSALAVTVTMVGIIADIASGDHERIAVVRVEMVNGHETVAVDYQKAIKGPVHVIVRVTNSETEVQRIGIMEVRTTDANGADASLLQPNRFPLVDGVVRHYTYPGEGQVVFWTTGTAAAAPAIERVAAPPARPESLSRLVEPGKTLRVELEKDLPKGTVLVVFSDIPGRYESGQWVEVVLN